MEFLEPEGWAKPKGYANGVKAKGELIFIAGQIGWNANQQFESDDFAEQVDQALRNVAAVCRAGGAEPTHITRMTWYITDKPAYLASLKQIGASWRAIMGRHFPAMAVVAVTALMEDRAKVEIEASAVIPEA